MAVNALGGGYSLDDLKKAAGDNENQPPIVGDRTVSGLGNLPGFDLMADGELALDLLVLLGSFPAPGFWSISPSTTRTA